MHKVIRTTDCDYAHRLRIFSLSRRDLHDGPSAYKHTLSVAMSLFKVHVHRQSTGLRLVDRFLIMHMCVKAQPKVSVLGPNYSWVELST